MGTISNLFRKSPVPAPVIPKPAPQDDRFELPISSQDWAVCRFLGDPGTIILLALRLYLKRHRQLPTPPSEQSDQAHSMVRLAIPNDLKSALPWDADTYLYISAALKELFHQLQHTAPTETVRPTIQPGPEPILIGLLTSEVKRLRALGSSVGGHVLAACKARMQKTGALQPDSLEIQLWPESGDSISELTWNPSVNDARYVPNASYRHEWVRAAIRDHLKTEEAKANA